MRVLMVAPEPFFDLRGTPINVYQMCRALTGAGHEVHLATYPFGEDVSVDGLTVHRALRMPGIRFIPIGFSRAKMIQDLSLAALLAKLLLTQRFDVIHAIEESVFFCGPASRLSKTPLIYDLDSIISDQLRYQGVVKSERILGSIRGMERRALKRSACVVTVCEALTEHVQSVFPEHRVFQIEDTPLEAVLQEPPAEEVESLRAKLGVSGRRVLLYTGNLEQYQGVETLVRSMPRILEGCPEAALLIVGGESAQIESLRAEARSLNVGERTIFCGKQLPNRLPAYMGLAELLLSARSEGTNTPLKIYTYMMSGLPIVATDLPTHTQVLDSSNAYLAPPTPDGFADAVLAALRDPRAAAGRARAAQERVERDYSFEAFSRKLVDVYKYVGNGASS